MGPRTDLFAVDGFRAVASHRRRSPVLHRRTGPRPQRHIAHACHPPQQKQGSAVPRLTGARKEDTNQSTGRARKEKKGSARNKELDRPAPPPPVVRWTAWRFPEARQINPKLCTFCPSFARNCNPIPVSEPT
jgi:hypothetical protein